ncbi:MAG: aldehyde dehydrogenase [Flavobacteriaceae bacterium]|nr:aldehyde dehydrogenase [Flavobacteriaceae bacterium]|tara:strand:+ start:3959 stop:5320 length:1362 start_codon:yes stop_codon:yes gene_type:complete
MNDIVSKQRTFFYTHKTKAIQFRLAQLNKLGTLLKSNEDLLYQAIYKDFKKSKFDTYVTELALLYQDLKEAKKNIHKWSRTKRVGTNMLNFPASSYIIPEPLGVCLVIGAWNYPYQLTLAPVIAAIAAGNTVIIKPSEMAPKTSALMANLINENFDSAFLKVVEGGVSETTTLLKSKFDKIFFTGSPQVGKIIYQAAAKNLTPVTLELGGKSPAIITEDANLKMTVKRLVWAKFLNAGQTCIAPDYVLVHKSIVKKTLELLKIEIEKESFSLENGNYTQIINERNLNRLSNMFSSENVFVGGRINTLNRLIEPTVLHDVKFSDDIMKEEIFGPILPVISYQNIEEVIQYVNGNPTPLACYVFTNNNQVKKKILNEISFGGGAVNDAIMHIANSKLPFGGIGNSGIGSYHGEAGFKSFSHFKSILEKSNLMELSLKYYPHSKRKLSWIQRFMGF